MANRWDSTCYWRGALRGGIGVYMRAVWCHERNAHAFGSQRKALGEHYTPEHAAQVTVTVSLLEVQWANDGPMMGQWWANDGPMMGQ